MQEFAVLRSGGKKVLAERGLAVDLVHDVDVPNQPEFAASRCHVPFYPGLPGFPLARTSGVRGPCGPGPDRWGRGHTDPAGPPAAAPASARGIPRANAATRARGRAD